MRNSEDELLLILSAMVSIIDKIDLLPDDCPEIKNSKVFVEINDKIKELSKYMSERSSEMNKQTDKMNKQIDDTQNNFTGVFDKTREDN